MELLLATMNDYVSFCDVLLCLCLIFDLILHFGVDAVNFSHFFLLAFNHANVGMSLHLTLYKILTRPMFSPPSLLLLFHALFCYKLLTSSLRGYRQQTLPFLLSLPLSLCR